MNRKTTTIDLKGKAYATVPARIKEFREICPNGDIKTEPVMQNDGSVMFTAYILKDKSDTNSASATGHSIGKLTGDKAFEKLETIAIGRALAILGFMASGDIASSEEMEEFQKHKMDTNPLNIKAHIMLNLKRLGVDITKKELIRTEITKLTGIPIEDDTNNEVLREIRDSLELLITKKFNEGN
jgi:hypothetical protein